MARSARYESALAASFATAIVVLLVGTASYWTAHEVRASQQWLRRAQDVRTTLSNVAASLSNAHIAARSFALQQEERDFLEYNNACQRTRESVEVLASLLLDTPDSHEKTRQLRAHANATLLSLHSFLSNSKHGALEQDAGRAARTALARDMEQVFSDVADLRAHEEKRLQTLSRNLERSMFLSQLVIATGSILAAVFALGSALALRSAFVDRKRAEEALAARNAELRAALNQLARSNQDLDQFAYIISHDLKSPLRGIANLCSWISEDLGDNIPAETKEHIRLLHTRVARMESLIDAVLQYARAGRDSTPSQLVDAGSLVREVLDLLAPPPSATIHIQPDMPQLLTSRVLLEQVLINLLGNALKFAPAGDAHVRVTWRDHGDLLELAVHDNGPGIPPQHQTRIFEIFQTLSSRDRQEGTGIGLALVKKITSSVGGGVRVESDPGVGSTFFLSWPKDPRSTVANA